MAAFRRSGLRRGKKSIRDRLAVKLLHTHVALGVQIQNAKFKTVRIEFRHVSIWRAHSRISKIFSKF